MASKKKASSNGFSSFMFSYKAKEKANGRDLDMGTVTLEAGEIWDKMTNEEKAPYKNKNKEVPAASEVPDALKYNCNGVSFKEMERLKQNDMVAKRRMELTIEQILITAFENNELERHHFFLISVSYFIKRPSTLDIWPCELAMSEFCIQDGLVDFMHTLISPGKLPIGYAHEAMLHSNETHCLPPNMELHGERNYEKIFDMIMEFMSASEFSTKALPPIYTGLSEDELEAANLTLELLATEKGYDYNAFRIYPIEVLFFKLQNKCIQIQKNLNLNVNTLLGSVVLAKHCFDTDEYAFCEIGCEWHNKEDFAERCCLSKVKRWVYTISKHCIDARLRLLPGQHFPETHQKLDEVELHSTTSKESAGTMHLLNTRSSTDSVATGESTTTIASRLTGRNTDNSCGSSWIGSMIKREQAKRSNQKC